MKVVEWFVGKVFCRLLGFTVDFKKENGTPTLDIEIVSERGRKYLPMVLRKMSDKIKKEE